MKHYEADHTKGKATLQEMYAYNRQKYGGHGASCGGTRGLKQCPEALTNS